MCREKTAFLFPVQRIENKCKHITSRHVRTNGSEETGQKTVYIIWWYAENCQVITLF